MSTFFAELLESTLFSCLGHSLPIFSQVFCFPTSMQHFTQYSWSQNIFGIVLVLECNTKGIELTLVTLGYDKTAKSQSNKWEKGRVQEYPCLKRYNYAHIVNILCSFYIFGLGNYWCNGMWHVMCLCYLCLADSAMPACWLFGAHAHISSSWE